MNCTLNENAILEIIKKAIVQYSFSRGLTAPSPTTFSRILFTMQLYSIWLSPCRASNRFFIHSCTIFSILLAISSLWFPFGNRDGDGSVVSAPTVPVSLILSARFTRSIRSSKQINRATPLELIGELVILDGNFRHKVYRGLSTIPRRLRIETTCCTMARTILPFWVIYNVLRRHVYLRFKW